MYCTRGEISCTRKTSSSSFHLLASSFNGHENLYRNLILFIAKREMNFQLSIEKWVFRTYVR